MDKDDETSRRLTIRGGGSHFRDNRISTSNYTALNFLPKNLWRQFKRKANVYFLVMSIVMYIGSAFPRLYSTAISPWGTILTLIFVLGVTLIKDGLEDIKRHKADKKENHGKITLYDPNSDEYRHIKRKDLRVGDIALVHNKEQFPGDLIVVASENENGQCFVETANIDGETNLKIRKVPGILITSGRNSNQKVVNAGTIECDVPNKDIHNFSGVLRCDGHEIPLDASNFLLRGSVLRNTGWILGITVYTGEDSKIMKNRGVANPKTSNLENTVNKLFTYVFAAQFILVILSVIIGVICSATNNNLWYLLTSSQYIPIWLGNIFTFYTLYANFVPISLYVTVEMVNVAQGWFIESDLEMYDPVTDIHTLCRNSSLCQEIGQVEYVFSDKTGTLTQNVMEFKKAAIYGKEYNLDTSRDACEEKNSQVIEFFRLLGVCHTVVPDHEAPPDAVGIPAYEAESPDEGALVKAAAQVGLVFSEKTPESVYVVEFGVRKEYKILAVNEFNSTRKRMSSLVLNPDGEYVLYCKGADNVMLERVNMTKMEDARLNELLSLFAEDGLRTLVCGKRVVSKSTAEAWLKVHHAASIRVEGRADALAQAAEEIEKDMTVVGASAIEDKLQDQVPETIEDLRKAGIKVWVLTGDKLETAVNIGYSCRLLNDSMRVLTISNDDPKVIRDDLLNLESVLRVTADAQLYGKFRDRLRRVAQMFSMKQKRELALSIVRDAQQEQRNARVSVANSTARVARSASDNQEGIAMTEFQSEDKGLRYSVGDNESFVVDPTQVQDFSDVKHTDHLALVVDGRSLTHILDDIEMCEALLAVGKMCKSVIACRVSPAQKADIVSLIKDGSKTKPITLSIGDGANDVTMIQRAHVGVGIAGLEGRQAVNCSDFAIGQFRFLKKLLLVHGHWNYRRQGTVVCMMLYKNIALCLTLFIFNFWALMTGTSIYDTAIYAGYNFFTGAPPLLLGILDQDISPLVLMSVPALYVSGLESFYLNTDRLVQWGTRAIYQSAICAFIPIFVTLNFGLGSTASELYSFGTIVYACVLVAATVTMAVQTMTWTWIHLVFYAAGIALYFFVIMTLQFTLFTYKHVANLMLSTPQYWLICLLFTGALVYLFESMARVTRVKNIIDAGVSVSKRGDSESIKAFKIYCEGDATESLLPDGLIDEFMEETYSEDQVRDMSHMARRVSQANL